MLGSLQCGSHLSGRKGRYRNFPLTKQFIARLRSSREGYSERQGNGLFKATPDGGGEPVGRASSTRLVLVTLGPGGVFYTQLIG